MRTKTDRQQGKTTQWLLGLIEAFLDLNDLDPDGCNFGWYVMQDRSLVTRLRDGGDVTITKMDDILAFMQKPDARRRSGIDLKPLTIEPKELP